MRKTFCRLHAELVVLGPDEKFLPYLTNDHGIILRLMEAARRRNASIVVSVATAYCRICTCHSEHCIVVSWAGRHRNACMGFTGLSEMSDTNAVKKNQVKTEKLVHAYTAEENVTANGD